jgi:16S rRNA (uracil1498-N3)-methyltransferase
MTRIYQPIAICSATTLDLDNAASHHVARVLRMQVHDSITLFNGLGGEFNAQIVAINKRSVTVQVGEHIVRECESPVQIVLALGISRGEKMDYTIQKAVELGVTTIIPLLTERCNVKLDAEKRAKRSAHWQSIIISACEQSGRNKVPSLSPALTFSQWLPNLSGAYGFVLSPSSSYKLHQVQAKPISQVIVFIGPEGGLSPLEIQQASAYGLIPLNLGPRILRTETAALAALTAIQCHFGDMCR